MGFGYCNQIRVFALVLFFLLCSHIFTTKGFNDFQQEKEISEPSKDPNKMKLIEAYLEKLNKPYVKSIKSADGDIIDCVLIHLQPTFDFPELKRTFRSDIPPKIPKGHENAVLESDIKQLWNSNGESCPYGTVPIRRTSASDILRWGSVSEFGKKKTSSKVDRDDKGHEGFNDFEKKHKAFSSSNNQNKMELIEAYLKKVNKPYVKSIKSPDGDIIDCVLTHLQPAFDLPELKRTFRVNTPPTIPKGLKNEGSESEIKQLWNSNGEACPYGTIPIRRTSASDILRSGSISRFGKKKMSSKLNIHEKGHEFAMGFVSRREGDLYGAKATLNVWKPNVTSENEFSFSQIWVIHHAPGRLFNTIEAGWQVYPKMYKHSHLPKFFIYWTPDGYETGCFNLLCPGFVQTNNRIALGASVVPTSTYNGKQYDITILIWKDPSTGNWWLIFGKELVEKNVIGYWPASLFPYLRDNATLIRYGGEVYGEPLENLKHTSTQMGSGHLPEEGLGKAAYIGNMEMVDKENKIKSVSIESDLILASDQPNCYDVKSGVDDALDTYILFGGPGWSRNCHIQT